MKKEYLFTPGPTPVPPQVLGVMGLPIFHHRTKRYREMFERVTERMKNLFRTENDVLTFTSSGSGAMEASVVNLLSPGDKVITVNGGKFGERWSQLCRAYAVEALEIEQEWGTAVNPETIGEMLSGPGGKDVKAVYTTLCETSTGVLTDIEAIGKIVAETSAVLVVDSVSGLGADEFKADEWGVDVSVTGSQKGLMIPPGLAFAAVSQKAWNLVEQSTLPKFYFSMAKARKSLGTFDNPWTPALTLVRALEESLSMMFEEGIDQVIERHARLSVAARAGVKALGLSLFAPDSPSNAVTAVKVPEGIDGGVFVKKLLNEYGVQVAGGQEHVKGKIFRIAHLGYFERLDIILVLSAVEMALKELGVSVDLGAGLKAAEEVLAGEAVMAG